MMTEKYFKCTLLSDIVLNASLATEGNMTTLDYIPGSNFLGIVAGAIYGDESITNKYNLLHSDKICFSDAIISKANQIYYPMPFTYFKDKLNVDKNIYLHHLIDHKEGIKDAMGNKVQLKQERAGFMNANGVVIENINKTFALKSAQDRDTRSSKEGAMFGFESLKAGQAFIFSVKYTSDADIEIIEKYLTGNKRIGKSKSAEFGQVHIEIIENPKTIGTFTPENFTLVYAESNLCFIDETIGQSTFQPTAEQLGFAKEDKINWNLSSIRTYSYSPWNATRNTSNMQRHCIAKGSVFYVEKSVRASENNIVGEYTAEGLGRVIYNPAFLKGKGGGVLDFEIKPNKETKSAKKEIKPIKENIKSDLGKKLFKRYETKLEEKKIAQQVVNETNDGINDNLKKITASQWGGIRAIATNETDINKLYTKLFAIETGYLTHGVADEKHWGKNNGKNRNDFEKIFNDNKTLGSVFIAKLAGEFAKQSKKINK
jgi:hypothetical protein